MVTLLVLMLLLGAAVMLRPLGFADTPSAPSPPPVAAGEATAATPPGAAQPSAPPPQTDPYANLSDQDRYAMQEWDSATKELTPAERAAALNYMRTGIQWTRQQAEEAARKQQEAAQKAAQQPAASGNDQTAAALAALQKEMAELRGTLTAKERKSELEAAEAQLNSEIETAIDEEPLVKENPKLRELVRKATVGQLTEHYARTNGRVPFNAKNSARESAKYLREMVAEMATAEKQEWLRGKMADMLKTAGETGAGAAPGRVESSISPEQFEKGYLGDLVR
jgi:hypothetical protein